jgi:hypothetical protein
MPPVNLFTWIGAAVFAGTAILFSCALKDVLRLGRTPTEHRRRVKLLGRTLVIEMFAVSAVSASDALIRVCVILFVVTAVLAVLVFKNTLKVGRIPENRDRYLGYLCRALVIEVIVIWIIAAVILND